MYDFSGCWLSNYLQIHVQYKWTPIWAPVTYELQHISLHWPDWDREEAREGIPKGGDQEAWGLRSGCGVEVDGDTPGAEEMQEGAVYIPGAGSLSRLNNRDLQRLNKEGEGEFDTRFVSL